MGKPVATIVTLLAALLAIAVPVVVSLRIARDQAYDAEVARALRHARDVIHRSDATADQVDVAFRQLALASAPCSEANRALMRRIDVQSSYIQAIGHIDRDTLVCSSLGEPKPVPLGPPHLPRANGVRLRIDIRPAFAPDILCFAIERDGYIAFIHKDIPIDVSRPDQGVGLATVMRDEERALASRGFVDVTWARRLGSASEVTFEAGDHVVAVVRSKKYGTAAIASVPLAQVRTAATQAISTIAPASIVTGLLLAFAVLYLARQQTAMPAVLKAAIRREEFYIAYQPVVDLRSRRWTGAEALIRWRRAGGESVHPDMFIKVAEETGLIERITERVIELVERDARQLFRTYPELHLSINLSSVDLHAAGTVERLRQLARSLGAGPGNLMVEITERALTKPDVARHVIRDLRGAGILAAIDDFGTGYSSLAYLESFELDVLKIDKAFVDTVATDAATSQVILHIIEMAKSLKLRMIAEGVETEGQAGFLRERGVRHAQGFLFAKPMSYVELWERLRTNAG